MSRAICGVGGVIGARIRSPATDAPVDHGCDRAQTCSWNSGRVARRAPANAIELRDFALPSRRIGRWRCDIPFRRGGQAGGDGRPRDG